VAYLNISNSIDELTRAAGAFFALELLFHLINLVMAFYLDFIEKCHCIESAKGCFISFCVGIPYYVAINIAPALHLFLDSDSPFRDTYYEILTILNLFFGTALIELMMEIPMFDTFSSKDITQKLVAIVWSDIRFACSIILIPITLITQIVLTANILRDHDNEKETLKDYDLVIYYITLGEASVGLLTITILLCVLCCALPFFLCKK
jgi:hypothetical protein